MLRRSIDCFVILLLSGSMATVDAGPVHVWYQGWDGVDSIGSQRVDSFNFATGGSLPLVDRYYLTAPIGPSVKVDTTFFIMLDLYDPTKPDADLHISYEGNSKGFFHGGTNYADDRTWGYIDGVSTKATLGYRGKDVAISDQLLQRYLAPGVFTFSGYIGGGHSAELKLVGELRPGPLTQPSPIPEPSLLAFFSTVVAVLGLRRFRALR